VAGDGRAGIAGQLCGGDPQGQRQIPAEPGERAGGPGFRRDPVRTQDHGQQGLRFPGGKHVEDEGMGVVEGGEPEQVGPAGDQHGAGRAAGQQRPDLLGARGVVQDHERPAAREQGAIHRRLFGLGERDGRWGHAQPAQEHGQHVGGRHRRIRGVAAEVDVELGVRVPGGDPVRPAQGERGFADSADARDGGDHHGGRAAGVVQQGIQPSEVLLAAGEVRDVRG
jgi:hypothetical protein